MGGKKDGSKRKVTARSKASTRKSGGKGLKNLLGKKSKEMSKESKEKKEKKKQAKKSGEKKKADKKKKEESSSDKSDSDSGPAAPSVRSQITLKAPNSPKEALPGALAVAPTNPETYFLSLMQEERPDLFGKNSTVDPAEAEMLDYYLREKNELASADLIYVDDNFDQEDRCYIRYQIELKYNEGRYASLYIVTKHQLKDNEKSQDKAFFLLKCPLRKNSATSVTKIKREIRVMQDLNAAKAEICPTVLDFGKVCDSPFFVMSLLDMNLEKVRELQKGRVNGPTAIYIGMETLNCLAELHLRGYIHRDVKPANFCIGVGAQDKRVLIVDFGETVKKGRKLRVSPPDGYTLPYMSLDQHKKYGARERSDIESWYYMLIDFLQPELLSWKGKTNESEVESMKAQFWRGISIDSGMNDSRIQSIGEMINPKTTFEKADYAKMKQLLTIAMESMMSGGAKFTPQWSMK